MRFVLLKGSKLKTLILISLILVVPFASQAGINNSFIVGGELVEKSDLIAESTVFIYISDKNTNKTVKTCTGVVITNNSILSSASCLIDLATNPQLFAGIIFSTNLQGISTSQVRFGNFSSVFFHPEYIEAHNKNYDVAVLKYDGNLVDGYRPTYFEKVNFGLKPEGVFAGFGAYNSEGKMDYTLREVKKSIQFDSLNPFMFHINQEDQKGVCYGDQGGPVYFEKEGQMYLIGIVSSSQNTPNGLECSGITKSVNLTYEPIYEWIKSQL